MGVNGLILDTSVKEKLPNFDVKLNKPLIIIIQNKACVGLSFSTNLLQIHNPGFVRVLENLESPGILIWHFPGLESPGKRGLVLESSGNLLNATKKYEVYGR